MGRGFKGIGMTEELETIVVTIQNVSGKWHSRAKIEVPGLGEIDIQDCVSDVSIKELCKQVEFMCGKRMRNE